MNKNPEINELDERLKLKIVQIERIGPILFFLIPLITLLLFGKSVAVNILYLWLAMSLFYICCFRLITRKISNVKQQLILRRGWGNNRFYRLCWAYWVIFCLVAGGYLLFGN